MLRNISLYHLFVGLSVRKVYCGKTADWIRMRFGVVIGVGREMGPSSLYAERNAANKKSSNPVDMHTNGGSLSENRMTLTFDLLT